MYLYTSVFPVYSNYVFQKNNKKQNQTMPSFHLSLPDQYLSVRRVKQ